MWAADLRGHGESPAPADGDFAWELVTDDLLAAAAAIDEGPLHFFGHSMGGAVGLRAQVVRPGTFASAFVYEPIIFPPDFDRAPGPNAMAESARQRRETFPSREAALWRYASKPPLDVLGAGSLAAYVDDGFDDVEGGGVRLRCRAESEARTFEASGTITTETVRGVDLPLVVATGGAELSDLAPLGPRLVEVVPGSRLVVYEHLGHFGPFQDLHRIATDIVTHTHA